MRDSGKCPFDNLFCEHVGSCDDAFGLGHSGCSRAVGKVIRK
jgi:hypothetical protein